MTQPVPTKTEPSYIHPLVGTFQFQDLGRNKDSKTVKLTGEDSLWKAIKPHFMSKDIEYEYDALTHEGRIFVGGFRAGGTFKRTGP